MTLVKPEVELLTTTPKMMMIGEPFDDNVNDDDTNDDDWLQRFWGEH